MCAFKLINLPKYLTIPVTFPTNLLHLFYIFIFFWSSTDLYDGKFTKVFEHCAAKKGFCLIVQKHTFKYRVT